MAKVVEKPKTETTELSAAPAPSELGQAVVVADPKLTALDMLEKYSGSGFEDVKASDLALPQFKLLQATSSQVKRTEPDYIRGAREGLWLDAITRRLFAELTFIPCKFSTHYIEWTLETRGRLVANHGTDRTLYDMCKRDEKTGQDVTPSGKTVVVPTGTWYGIVIGGREIDPNVVEDKGSDVDMMSRAVITLSGTAQRVSRRWVSDAQSIQLKNRRGEFFKPPMFAMSYLMGSSATKNDQGSWFLPTVARGGWTLDYPNGAALFNEAQEFASFANEMQSQLITVTAADSHDVTPTGSGSTASRARSEPAGPREDVPLDEDLPF